MLDFLPSISEIWTSLIDVLKTNQFAQGGAVISFLMALPRYIIPWFVKLWQRIERLIVFTVNIEETDDLFMYFELWLQKHHEVKYRNVEAALKLDTKREWDNKDIISGEYLDEFEEKVLYKQFNDLFWVRRGFNYIRVFKGREKLENASSLRNAHYNKFVISGLFAKKTISNLISEVHEEAKERMKKEREKTIRVKTSTEYGDWVDENVIEPKSLNNIILKGKSELMTDINKFVGDKHWYKKRDIVYKRGYIFHGAAGTGKTSFIMSLAKELNRTVHFLQLNNINDSGIRNAFRSLPPQSILVVEDIDSAFKKREDGSKNIKFSFSTLLNCMDGVFATEDIITIFTTNHIELLDSALIRSGRIDYKMEFERPSHEYVKQFMDMFYESDITIPKSYNCLLPMVDVQDACLRFKTNHNDAIEWLLERDLYVKENGYQSLIGTIYDESDEEE